MTNQPTILTVPAADAPLSDVLMQTVVETTLGELTCFTQKTDAAGHVFTAYQINYANSNESAVIVAERDSTGRVLATWRVLPVTGFKLTTAGLAVAGRDLLVLGSGHHISNEANRQNEGMVAILPGVFTPPGEPGDSPFPESVLLAPVQQPTPGLSEADFTRIQGMLDTKFSLLVTAFGGSSIRAGLQEKAEDALVWLFTAPDTDDRIAVARAFRDAFYGQVTNIIWAQQWKVAIESGQVDKALAPDPIRRLSGFPWGR